MIKYLKTRWKTGVLALLMVAVTAGILFLYDISLEPVGYVNIINLRKKWKGICSQVPFIVLKYRQGCI